MPSPILTLPPELFFIIAFHLPLQCYSSTLLALSLAACQLNEFVQVLLYFKVVIKSEDSAFLVLKKLSKDIHLGVLVGELHILTDFSPALCDARGGTTVITELHSVIKMGCIPNLYALSIVFLPGWYTDEYWIEDVEFYDHLTSELWKDLKLKCPRLRRLYLEGIGDTCNDPWIDASGLYELKELQVRVDIPAVTRIDHPIDVGFPSI